MPLQRSMELKRQDFLEFPQRFMLKRAKARAPGMMRNLVRPCVGLLVSGYLCAPALAGIVVTENVSPGATSWPGTPLISTVSNPAGQVAVTESFNGNGATNYCETFTIASSCTLQGISLYAGQGSGTGAGTNLTLRLFDLGAQTAPNPSAYTPGSDLFNSGSGLAIAYTP